MAIKPNQQAEPIPGYVLVERLGQGGFGEVWKAIAPGGIPKAIKFVHGSIHDDDNKTAAQELKSLNRMKSVHHPFILGVERVDVIDGQVVIVMELADRDLLNRQQECQRQGFAGIPRDELLRYLTETAEALDLMNAEYQLQHLDIKPQNLFLVRNHIKVADFGLAKDLEGMTASLSAGITPVYASPETFDGKVTRFSDQYSLAIVYQEMLTGKRPFNGTNARMLLMQHCKLPPDLTPLPTAEQPIVERALAKNPNERWPTCTAFVDALRAVPQTASWSAEAPSPAPQPSPTPAVAETDVPTIQFVPPSKAPAGTKEPAAEADDADDDLYGGDQSGRFGSEPDMESPGRLDEDYSSKRTFIRPPAAKEPARPAKGDSVRRPVPRDETVGRNSPKDDTVQHRPSKDETVRLKAVSQTVQLQRLPAAAQASPCPRCGGPLSDPDTLAWCPKCGYFASQDGDKAKTQTGGVKGVLRLIEPWQWTLMGGATLIVAVTIAISVVVPERSPLRALIGLGQLVAAVLGLIVAHVWAMRLACWFADGKLSMVDVLRLPVLVWKAMFHHLPDSSWPICVSTWSGTLALCALFLGGLGHRADKPKPGPTGPAVDPIVARQQQLEAEAQAKLAERKRKWASEPNIPAKPVNLDRDLDEFVIVGYVRSGKETGNITAVVLATSRLGKLLHVGTTSQGLTLADNQLLAKRVETLPLGDAPEDWNAAAFKEVVWLPTGNRLRAVIDHAGIDKDGVVTDPSYRRLKD